MSALWTWPELCSALKLPAAQGPDIQGVSIDSRRVRPGDLFIALTGDPGARFNPSRRSTRDGHDFIDDAVARGAAGVLAHDGRSRRIAQLQVADTLDALWQLGRAGRGRLSGPVVAVTGSSGKTTAKSFLAAALNAFATEGSLNNHLGVPLSLALAPRESRAAVFEIGTNHPGEIAPLSELAQPDVAVVLNVHAAHVENFESMDQLLEEKLSIYRGLTDKGQLVLESSLDARALPEDLAIARFGPALDCRVRLLEVDDATALYQVRGQRVRARVPGGGVHRAATLGAVICVLDVLNLDLAPALELPETLIPAGRGRTHRVSGITVVDDSYNANPQSMAAALDSFRARSDGRKLALLGEMLELGGAAPSFHAGLASHCEGLDAVLSVGQGMRNLHDALPAGTEKHWQETADDALMDELLGALQPGDQLLIKGSNRVFWANEFASRLIAKLRSKAG